MTADVNRELTNVGASVHAGRSLLHKFQGKVFREKAAVWGAFAVYVLTVLAILYQRLLAGWLPVGGSIQPPGTADPDPSMPAQGHASEL